MTGTNEDWITGMHGAPLRVGVIGAGRVGAVLGAALADAGHLITAVSAASAASLDRARRLLPQTPVVAPDRVPDNTELVLLAVPDDCLPGLARALPVRPGQVVVHTSGAHGLDVLTPATARGAKGMAFHPAMTFTGHRNDLDRIAAGISYGVTAGPDERVLATRLAADLGGSIEWIEESARPLYHAALAHGANHLVTLVNEAADLLRGAGVLHPERVLSPLLRAALDNALAQGDAALTGPVSRGDAGTLERHLAALRSVAPDSVPAYLALARRTADRAIASGRLRPADAESLLGALAAQPSTAELHS